MNAQAVVVHRPSPAEYRAAVSVHPPSPEGSGHLLAGGLPLLSPSVPFVWRHRSPSRISPSEPRDSERAPSDDHRDIACLPVVAPDSQLDRVAWPESSALQRSSYLRATIPADNAVTTFDPCLRRRRARENLPHLHLTAVSTGDFGVGDPQPAAGFGALLRLPREHHPQCQARRDDGR